MSEPDAIVVTTVVAVDADAAFAIFTDEVDHWWRREPRFRTGAVPGVMRFDRDRLVEIGPAGEVEIARVIAWEPPRRLVVAWRAATRVLGADTEVEVRFEPEGDGTRVTIEHRGWGRVPAKHPSRGGLTGVAFGGLVGSWWADLLTALRSDARSRT